MNILIIDQLIKMIKESKFIKFWSRNSEEDSGKNNIPTEPIVIANTNTSINSYNIESNSTNDHIMEDSKTWVNSTVTSEAKYAVKTNVFRKLIKFMRRQKKGKARGA